jgi:hypothetical protein
MLKTNSSTLGTSSTLDSSPTPVSIALPLAGSTM